MNRNGAALELDDDALVRVLKALAHPKRFRMVQEIAADGELSCGALGGCVEVAQPTVSHHLKILCDAGVVIIRREAQRGYLSVNQPLLDAALRLLPGRIRDGAATATPVAARKHRRTS